MSTLLKQARDALDHSDDATARARLLDHWKETRSPWTAELIARIDARSPTPLKTQLRAIITPRVAPSLAQFKRLHHVDDPELGRWVLDALADPPFCAVTAEPFLRALVDTLERLRDARLVDELPRIRDVLRARLARKPMYERLTAQLERIARTHRPAPQLEAERDLERRLPREHAAEDLLASVYATPDDDMPRRVYADFLLARDDPRGELIALQLARRRDEPPTPRELELLKAHGEKWLGPLAIVLSWGERHSKTRFERGFVAHADVMDAIDKKARLVAEEPAWATVESFQWGRVPRAVLARAPLRSLRALGMRLDAQKLQELLKRSTPLPRVEHAAVDFIEQWPPRLFSVLPRLKRLEVSMDAPLPERDLGSALALPLEWVHVSGFHRQDRAGELRHEAALDALDGREATITELIVEFPYRDSEQKPARFRRDASGRLRREKR